MTKDSNKADKKNASQSRPYPHRQRAGRGGQGKSGAADAAAAGPTSTLNAPCHLPSQPSGSGEPALVRAVGRCSELEGQIKVTEAKRQVLQAQLMEARRVAVLAQQ